MANIKKSIRTIKRISVPWYITLLFALAAVALVPWLIHLSHTLPVTHLDRDWDKAWAGLDIAEFAAIGLTALFGALRSNWIIITSTAAGTLLLFDAWFDTTTAGNVHEHTISILSAILLEIPLAAIAYFVAYKATRRISSNS
jgi:hypothetical protein